MDYITNVFHMSVEPEDLVAFKELVGEIVAASSKEPGTFIYEYSASEDEREVHIVERYRADSVLTHVENTFAPFAERFLKMARIERLYVYGNAPADVKSKLDVFGAHYMSPLAGFSKPIAAS